MDASNFLDYSEGLYGFVRWATAPIGRRFVGVLAVLGNAVAQGATQVLVNRLPSHPDCAPDANDQIGKDRELFRYKGESDGTWAGRVHDAWGPYEQGGTTFTVLSEVENWGNAAFPGTWPSGQTLEEDGWAAFIVNLPFGSVPWGPPVTYNSGAAYDSGAMYDVSGADPVDIDHLRKLIRKWKPARSKAKIRVPLVPVVYWGDGSTHWNGGAHWAGPTDILVLGV